MNFNTLEEAQEKQASLLFFYIYLYQLTVLQ